MLRLQDIQIEKETTHLFFPMVDILEVSWLLKEAKVNPEECYVRPWRKVLNHQVPAIKDINDAERNREIKERYGADCQYIINAPAVIISHFNPDDLFAALLNTFEGEGDSDYKAYKKRKTDAMKKEQKE